MSAFQYQGVWDASTNTPNLADGSGTTGDTYEIGTTGTQDLGGGSVEYLAGNLLLYNGTVWQQAGSGNVPVPANPTSIVGTSAVNGVASTFMRSDAAPKIDLAISPTWTGNHNFNGTQTNFNGGAAANVLNVFTSNSGAGGPNSAITIQSTGWAAFGVGRMGAATDQKWWDLSVLSSGALAARAISDDGATAVTPLQISRSGTTITGIASNSGSGAWTQTGPLSVTQSGGNGLVITPNVSASPPSIATAGANANINLDVNTKGTGVISLNSATSIVPSGTTQLSVTASDIAAGSGYTPANPQSLATKQYVDTAVGGGTTVASGTYTPTTIVSGCSCSASAFAPFSYTQIGSVVSVTGAFDVIPSTVGVKSFSFTLPVATTFSSVWQATGVSTVTDWNVGTINGPGIVYGNSNGPANNVVAYWNSPDTARQIIRLTFTYTVQ